jgi:hypothetical protein
VSGLLLLVGALLQCLHLHVRHHRPGIAVQ